ncbi:hypothetical protein B0H21DRAFT_691374, partial [Amylocystis lapponica]
HACYLLKSIHTPASQRLKTILIPVRFLNQRHSDMIQGAWKANHDLPWVMQMITHSLPSEPPAL